MVMFYFNEGNLYFKAIVVFSPLLRLNTDEQGMEDSVVLHIKRSVDSRIVLEWSGTEF